MKALQLVLVAVAILFLTAAPAMAFTTTDASGKTVGGPDTPVFSGGAAGGGFGAGLIILGAGLGFGRIGAAALESMARQPEVANRVQVAMIIIAALLEGVAFFGLVICLLIGNKAIF